MILYRPMGINELQLMYEKGMREFPPRKPEQPIFYPVLNLSYANEIAERWNTESESAAGYAAKFTLDDEYGAQFEPQKVGASHHLELWIPSEELPRFNQHISPPITIVSAFFGKNFRGHIPTQFGLRGMDATGQFVALANTLDYGPMDFHLEILVNHLTIFLNYAFWIKNDFINRGIPEAKQQLVLTAIRKSWSRGFPSIALPLTQ